MGNSNLNVRRCPSPVPSGKRHRSTRPVRLTPFPWKVLAAMLMLLSPANRGIAQQATPPETGTRAERLRGSITPERQWWDVLHYDLSIRVHPQRRSIDGTNRMTFCVLQPRQRMQIDLQPPLQLESVRWDDQELTFTRDENVYWIDFPQALPVRSEQAIEMQWEGKPVESTNPPWSGGFTWANDDQGRPFIATSCQGIGASIWWPNKDIGYDEPDRGMWIRVTVPEDLVAVSNGRLKKTEHDPAQKTRTWHWQVTQPINNYGVNLNIGHYVSFAETYQGEFGSLDMQYWVLDNQRQQAERQFREAPRTIEAFEYWFGKYPFYQDGYKLVVVPYLGMEHQSSVTYGNGFRNGYRGIDLSGTGVGLKFDFIIVHESGHEWFGNNISMRDIADMWIHESFTNYAESLFVEYHFSRREAEDYVIGCRARIKNDRPIIGIYGLNREGSGDMYYKGGNMLHTMRHIIADDARWRAILKGLNRTFWHQTVTSQQVEDYISAQAGIDFSKYFEQYLRTTSIPRLVYHIQGNRLQYHLEQIVDGFAYPVDVQINGDSLRIVPRKEVQVLDWGRPIQSFEVDRNFYIESVQR